MKIELAKSYGFCFGVKRAIKIAQNAKDAATIGELIHNSLEIDRLRKNYNVKTLKDIDELTDEKKAIIRTHGITKEKLATLKMREIEVIDATCPFVTKLHQIAKKMSDEGYDIVFFGDISHPEIKGAMSYATTKAYAALTPNELDAVKFSGKVAIISQTTKKIENFMQMVNYLMTRVKEVRVFNTICNATLENQEATRELSSRADIMIIIGGKNSSNTKQLLLIAQNLCKDSYLVESDSEIDEAWFRGKSLCGVTAGASTPEWIIKKIVEKIGNFC